MKKIIIALTALIIATLFSILLTITEFLIKLSEKKPYKLNYENNNI